MKVELKPCPHCGGKVDYNFDLKLMPDGVKCRRCKMIVHYYGIKYKSTDRFEVPMSQIAELWNRRANEIMEDDRR